MYIVGLNCTEQFYFISKEEQRAKLEEKGILVLNTSFDKLTAAANLVKELNQKAEKNQRKLSFSY